MNIFRIISTYSGSRFNFLDLAARGEQEFTSAVEENRLPGHQAKLLF